MGKGGRSSSSSTTTNTNTSGQNAIDGDNLGVSIAGVNDSSVHVTMTDHGAMQRASDLSELALLSNADVTEEALWSMADVTEAALAMGESSVSEAMDFGRDSLEGAFQFGSDAMLLNAEVSSNAIDEVSQAHHENLQMIAGLAGNQAAQNTENLAALKDLAGMKSDGGQVSTSRQMTIVVGLVMTFMAIMMLGGKR
ncbi:chemotaxis protein [Photobacterium sp. DNB22_13_2]